MLHTKSSWHAKSVKCWNINNYLHKKTQKTYFHQIWNGLKLTDAHTSEVQICPCFWSAFIWTLNMSQWGQWQTCFRRVYSLHWPENNIQQHYCFIQNLAYHLHRFPTDVKNCFLPFYQAVFKKAYIRYNPMMRMKLHSFSLNCREKTKRYKFLIKCAVIQVTSCKTPVGVLPWTCRSEGKWPSR